MKVSRHSLIRSSKTFAELAMWNCNNRSRPTPPLPGISGNKTPSCSLPTVISWSTKAFPRNLGAALHCSQAYFRPSRTQHEAHAAAGPSQSPGFHGPQSCAPLHTATEVQSVLVDFGSQFDFFSCLLLFCIRPEGFLNGMESGNNHR